MVGRLQLASVGNPDFGQDPDAPYWMCEPDVMVDVETLEEASQRCRDFIRENELGCGHWAGGQVYYDGEQIAYISYNGRVWKDLELHEDITGDDLKMEIDDYADACKTRAN